MKVGQGASQQITNQMHKFKGGLTQDPVYLCVLLILC